MLPSDRLRNVLRTRKPLSAAERLVLVVLAHHENSETGASYPGVATLLLETGLSKNWLQATIGKLIARAAIRATDRGGGRGRAAVYHINHGWLQEPARTETTPLSGGVLGTETTPLSGGVLGTETTPLSGGVLDYLHIRNPPTHSVKPPHSQCETPPLTVQTPPLQRIHREEEGEEKGEKRELRSAQKTSDEDRSEVEGGSNPAVEPVPTRQHTRPSDRATGRAAPAVPTASPRQRSHGPPDDQDEGKPSTPSTLAQRAWRSAWRRRWPNEHPALWLGKERKLVNVLVDHYGQSDVEKALSSFVEDWDQWRKRFHWVDDKERPTIGFLQSQQETVFDVVRNGRPIVPPKTGLLVLPGLKDPRLTMELAKKDPVKYAAISQGKE